MSTLYVIEQGARIEKEYHRMLVTKKDEAIQRVPMARLTHVVLVGNVGVTTPALHALLTHDVSLSLVRQDGRLLGRLQAPRSRHAELRRSQYLIESDPAFCLRFARNVVMGKLRNSLSMVRRIGRRHQEWQEETSRIAEALKQTLKLSRTAPSLADLRGAEGLAARRYFAYLRRSVPPAFGFQRRTRRPPTDPFNALLSLGYTLLTQAMMTALEVAGLDPYIGFLHAEKYGRPALALDLVEEFRVPIVDSLVLLLVNKQMIQPEDFSRGKDGGTYLNDAALRIFFREFTDRLNTRKAHPLARRTLSYRKIFEVQARLVAKTICGEIADYPPFNWR